MLCCAVRCRVHPAVAPTFPPTPRINFDILVISESDKSHQFETFYTSDTTSDFVLQTKCTGRGNCHDQSFEEDERSMSMQVPAQELSHTPKNPRNQLSTPNLQQDQELKAQLCEHDLSSTVVASVGFPSLVPISFGVAPVATLFAPRVVERLVLSLRGLVRTQCARVNITILDKPSQNSVAHENQYCGRRSGGRKSSQEFPGVDFSFSSRPAHPRILACASRIITSQPPHIHTHAQPPKHLFSEGQPHSVPLHPHYFDFLAKSWEISHSSIPIEKTQHHTQL